MTMGESRQELLAWLNDLLQLNYTKIEQVGTGAALCQIFDTIYGDVLLSKVKFNTNQEYEYVNNFKVLQKTFTDHQVDKVIPVERLVKCRFQDNLEFLQWVKKYWDTYFPGGNYDAVARRKAPSSVSASRNVVRKSGSNMSIDKSFSKSSMSKPANVKSSGLVTKTPAVNNSVVAELNQQITQLQVTVDGLEKERDFYFAKLRDVEVAVQNYMESQAQDESVLQFCKDIQTILYSTEDGFEVPSENAVEETY